jgi:anti-sigma factor RsiW
MNCREMEANLISYTDGRATDVERAAVERHIESCAACRARVAEFRGVWSALDEAPALEPSPSFDARLRQRLSAEPRRNAWFGWLMPWPRLALATAAIALLAVWVATPRVQAPKEDDPAAVAMVEQDLEDYDMLADFDALSTLSTPSGSETPAPAKDKM